MSLIFFIHVISFAEVSLLWLRILIVYYLNYCNGLFGSTIWLIWPLLYILSLLFLLLLLLFVTLHLLVLVYRHPLYQHATIVHRNLYQHATTFFQKLQKGTKQHIVFATKTVILTFRSVISRIHCVLGRPLTWFRQKTTVKSYFAKPYKNLQLREKKLQPCRQITKEKGKQTYLSFQLEMFLNYFSFKSP